MPPAKPQPTPLETAFKRDQNRLLLGTIIAAGILTRINKSPTSLVDEVEAHLKELEKRLT